MHTITIGEWTVLASSVIVFAVVVTTAYRIMSTLTGCLGEFSISNLRIFKSSEEGKILDNLRSQT